MPRVSPEHMQDRRDQIARAALKEFSQRGIHSTSMANILEASGLSTGTIYTHFTSKDDIITYVTRTAIDRVFAEIKSLILADPPPKPGELIRLVANGIKDSDMPTRFIIQAWGEAATNTAVRNTTNESYKHTFALLDDYMTTWLNAKQGVDTDTARERAPARARVLLSLIYAHILQDALVDNSDRPSLADDLAMWGSS